MCLMKNGGSVVLTYSAPNEILCFCVDAQLIVRRCLMCQIRFPTHGVFVVAPLNTALCLKRGVGDYVRVRDESFPLCFNRQKDNCLQKYPLLCFQ